MESKETTTRKTYDIKDTEIHLAEWMNEMVQIPDTPFFIYKDAAPEVEARLRESVLKIPSQDLEAIMMFGINAFALDNLTSDDGTLGLAYDAQFVKKDGGRNLGLNFPNMSYAAQKVWLIQNRGMLRGWGLYAFMN